MANSDDSPTDQHFCLRWNNFQANITSQFEALRSSEDFTDVTIACEGQRLLAHKVVLSACSPYFKELFKTNPCSHPIIFMKDVEAQHIIALMEFMYAGEVNVSQAHLSDFLKTAESLKICGLTDTSSELECEPGESSLRLKPQNTKILRPNQSVEIKPRNIQLTPTSTVTSSQDVPMDVSNVINPIVSSPSPKKSKSETEIRVRKDDSMTVNPFAIQTEPRAQIELIPKVELPEYFSDDDHDDNNGYSTINFYSANGIEDIIGNNDKSDETILNYNSNLLSELPSQSNGNRKLHSLDPRPCEECGKVYSNLSNLRQHMKLIHYPTYVSCILCNKQFKTDLYLRRHLQNAHHDSEINSEKCIGNFDFKYDKNFRFRKNY